MFPDPHRRRPRFEFPGSTGAGPWHQGIHSPSSLSARMSGSGCVSQPRDRTSDPQLSLHDSLQWPPVSDPSSCPLPLYLGKGTLLLAPDTTLKKKKVKMLVAQSCPTPYDPMDCSPPGSSIHGILQARILQWVAIPFSRGSSQSRDWTCICCMRTEPPGKPNISLPLMISLPFAHTSINSPFINPAWS